MPARGERKINHLGEIMAGYIAVIGHTDTCINTCTHACARPHIASPDASGSNARAANPVLKSSTHGRDSRRGSHCGHARPTALTHTRTCVTLAISSEHHCTGHPTGRKSSRHTLHESAAPREVFDPGGGGRRRTGSHRPMHIIIQVTNKEMAHLADGTRWNWSAHAAMGGQVRPRRHLK